MAALTMTIAQVKFGTGIGTLTDDAATRLGGMASEIVEKYAPGAPDGIKLEAAMRCVGWWAQSAAFPVSSRSFGDAGSVDYALTRLNPLLHSGASMILTPWRIHTLGVV